MAAPTAENADNHALRIDFNPNGGAQANRVLQLQKTGAVKVNPNRLYQLSFKFKSNYEKPVGAADLAIQVEVSDNIKDKFATQRGGTYAGPSVPYGDDPNFRISPSMPLKYPRGYTWMFDVDKAENTGENAFWMDYKITDFRNLSRNPNIDFRLRVTALNDFAAETGNERKDG